MAAEPTGTARRGTAYTVGHSTRSLDELVEILKAHGVAAVADVRLFPRSRRHPHFNDEALAASLPKLGLQYLPFPDLGGRRRPRRDTPNTGWREEGFRGYADYMQTEPFRAAIDRFTAVASQTITTVMCAEAVPWRCHRRLIADALLVRGWRVLDVMSREKATPHKLTPFAVVRGQEIVYPDPQQGLFTDGGGAGM